MEETTSKSTENTNDSRDSLRWYQFRLSSILWLTLIVALLVTNIIMRKQMSTVEQQLEKIKKEGAMREAEPGCITEVGFGPGWIFRGDLPKGKWRLAVYYWNGKLKNILDEAPPSDLAPLFATQIPSYKMVDIEITETDLPPNTLYEGKAVKTAYNFKAFYSFPGHSTAFTQSMGPVLLSTKFGETYFHPKVTPLPGKRGVAFWSKGLMHDGDHLVLKIEPMDEKSLPPQRDKEFYYERSRQIEEELKKEL